MKIQYRKFLKKITQNTSIKSIGNLPNVIKFFNDLQNNKLRDEEILLLHYANETARIKLGTGWKSDDEITNIKTWEDIHELNSKLSSSYQDMIRRFEFKKLTEVTEVTGGGNPREIMFIHDLQEVLQEFPDVINLKIQEVLNHNKKNNSDPNWDIT